MAAQCNASRLDLAGTTRAIPTVETVVPNHGNVVLQVPPLRGSRIVGIETGTTMARAIKVERLHRGRLPVEMVTAMAGTEELLLARHHGSSMLLLLLHLLAVLLATAMVAIRVTVNRLVATELPLHRRLLLQELAVSLHGSKARHRRLHRMMLCRRLHRRMKLHLRHQAMTI